MTPLLLLLISDSLIPGPGQTGSDPALHALAGEYDRQFHIFNAAPFGISLDAFIPNPNHRSMVDGFFAQSATNDFTAFTGGTSVEDVVSQRGEYGDLGMFGGVPAAAEAFRYMVLRDGGATTAEVDAARADLLDAIDAFHVYTTVTGEPGTIARGIRRTNEVGPAPEPFPAVCPDPWNRPDAIWRDDRSGQYPDWYFMDNTSKDQLIGYVYALGAFWDAIGDDPTIPQAVKTTLQADAEAMGTSLRAMVEVRTGTQVDLVIRGAGGCLVRFNDLNPRLVPIDGAQPLVLSETSANRVGFNALAALGIIRTLYHITGSTQLRDFYYDEMITARGYPAQVSSGAARLRQIFVNACVGGSCGVTNFSNVNMAYVSIYGLLRYETDPTLRTTYQTILQGELWSGPRPHMGVEIQQAFFNLMWAGFRAGASDDPQAANAASSLAEWPSPPYWAPVVENCDAAELAAGVCIAIDNTTMITIDDIPSRGNRPAGEDPLPKRLRVPNNFEWRSDPRVVNGGGGVILNPGGDFRGAYWLGRMLQSTPDTLDNVSPIARNRDGTGGPGNMMTPDAGVMDSGPMPDAGMVVDMGIVEDAAAPIDAGTEDTGATPDDTGIKPEVDSGSVSPVDTGVVTDPITQPEEGCGCSAAERSASPLGLPLLMLGLLVRSWRRRRSRVRGGRSRCR